MQLILKGTPSHFKCSANIVTFIRKGFESGYSWVLDPVYNQKRLVSNDFLRHLDNSEFKGGSNQ